MICLSSTTPLFSRHSIKTIEQDTPGLFKFRDQLWYNHPMQDGLHNINSDCCPTRATVYKLDDIVASVKGGSLFSLCQEFACVYADCPYAHYQTRFTITDVQTKQERKCSINFSDPKSLFILYCDQDLIILTLVNDSFKKIIYFDNITKLSLVCDAQIKHIYGIFRTDEMIWVIYQSFDKFPHSVLKLELTKRIYYDNLYGFADLVRCYPPTQMSSYLVQGIH